MNYDLPISIKTTLAARSVRLHHLLWHMIRNSWHDFTDAERARMAQRHPKWVPRIPRYLKGPSTPTNRSGNRVNLEAGESFLYMHREMIASVNAQLLGLGRPVLAPWVQLPKPDDEDFPVPGRENGRPEKSDAFGEEVERRMARVTDRDWLRARSLAEVGATVESGIHDPMHMRWSAVDAGEMATFPVFNPLSTIAPNLPERLDAPEVDWLGHPYSSHVNGVFWKLHGWVDSVIEKWRVAHGLEAVRWTDTWTGDSPDHASGSLVAPMGRHLRLMKIHDHMSHGHHGSHDLMSVLATVSQFPGCHIGFDYVQKLGIPVDELFV